MKLDELMSMSLDQLADLPGFEPPPNGSYRLKLSVEKKQINGADAVEFRYEVLQVVEQSDPSQPAAEAGKKFSEAFKLDNETGVGYFKLAAAPIMAHFKLATFAAFFEQCKQPLEVFGVVKQRSYEKDGEKRISGNVSNLRVL